MTSLLNCSTIPINRIILLLEREDIEIWGNIGIISGIDFSSYEASIFGNVRSIDRDIKYKDGRVKRHKGVLLSPYKNKVTGYMQICLHCDGRQYLFSVHELVMKVHRPNPNPEIYTDINHIDEDKTNNRLDNLEWTTHKENCNHGTSIERMAQRLRDNFIPDEYNNLEKENLIELIREKTTIKEMKAHKSSNKPIMQFSKNGEFIREYPSIVNAAIVKPYICTTLLLCFLSLYDIIPIESEVTILFCSHLI